MLRFSVQDVAVKAIEMGAIGSIHDSFIFTDSIAAGKFLAWYDEYLINLEESFKLGEHI